MLPKISKKVLHGDCGPVGVVNALQGLSDPVLHEVCASAWSSVVGLWYPRDLERYFRSFVDVPKKICGPTGACYGAAVGQWFCKSW